MCRRRIAVVGSGIAGLTAGYVLSRTDDVTLFEADDRLGGHAHTHALRPGPGEVGSAGAGTAGELMVDSGFIMHNRRTYPLLTRLFGELGVAVQPSEMSMSVSCAGCGLRYAGHRGLGGLLPGFFVVFQSAGAAVSCCLAAQRALSAHAWPDEVTVRVRMGLHCGELSPSVPSRCRRTRRSRIAAWRAGPTAPRHTDLRDGRAAPSIPRRH
jgi:hypothetical protein